MRNRFTLILILFLSFNSLQADPIYYQLTNVEQFKSLSTEPLSAKYGQVRGVKVVYDMRTRKLHYVDGKEYRYHYMYCNKKLRFAEDLQIFNAQNYSTDAKRRFILGNINYFEALNKYVLEFSPVDQVTPSHISTLYNNITRTSFIKKELTLLINSVHLNKITDQISSAIPTIKPADIYANLNYQAISKYKGTGTLKFIANLSESINEIKPTDIIVIKETPLYLPQVAGIIVTEFQTPLSHISILGQNRKLPVAAYKDAFTDFNLRALDGKNVQLTIETDTFKIAHSLNSPTGFMPQGSIKLRYDITVDSLIDITYLNRNHQNIVGNKAANFAYLHHLSKLFDFNTPELAYAIPFYFYSEHLRQSKTNQVIDSLLASKDIMDNHDSLQLFLKRIRNIIKNEPINPDLITALENKLSGQTKYTRFRFRSSTNAEDAVGFSGAGLYTSKTGILGNDKKSFEKAIKTVWASMWSYEAFTERQYYNIEHKEAFMGVLVHRAFPDEDVNGVAITKNIYRPGNYGYVVNAQVGNENVVNPTPGVTCDQFVCFPDLKMKIYADKNSVDIITVSSLNNGNLVMSDEEIKHLANQLRRIKTKYFKSASTTKSFVDFGLDIEFKLDGPDRTLYIKQARYYND